MPQIVGLINAQAAAAVSCFGTEPTLADLFGDPMTRAMMAADNVDDCDLQALLQRASHFITASAQNP